MAHLPLNFTGCVLLLLLLLQWDYRTTDASPVRHDAFRQCANTELFKSLLSNLSKLLHNSDVWHGVINRSLNQSASNETVRTCAPALIKNGCHHERKESFSEMDCLENILKDLVHYKAIISSYIKLENLRSPDEEVPPLIQTLCIIHRIREACSQVPAENIEEDDSGDWEDNGYSNRQRLLMKMRGFHVRTITFNRAVGYIASGDHLQSRPS